MTSVENIWMKVIVSDMAACTMMSLVDLVVTSLGYFKLECVCVNILVRRTRSHIGCGAYPLFYAMGPGEQVPLPGLKRLERKVDHRPPASAEVKNERRCTLIRCVLMAWTGRTVSKFLRLGHSINVTWKLQSLQFD
jgi:hypothetical protein